jgi:hypothetical protein
MFKPLWMRTWQLGRLRARRRAMPSAHDQPCKQKHHTASQIEAGVPKGVHAHRAQENRTRDGYAPEGNRDRFHVAPVSRQRQFSRAHHMRRENRLTILRDQRGVHKDSQIESRTFRWSLSADAWSRAQPRELIHEEPPDTGGPAARNRAGQQKKPSPIKGLASFIGAQGGTRTPTELPATTSR